MEAKIEEALHKERDSNEKNNVSITGSRNNEEEEGFFSSVIQTEERAKGHKSLKKKAQD